MTMEQAVDYLSNNWGFEGEILGILPFEHEFAHQVIAICGIYNPKLRFLMPQSNPNDHKMHAKAYNGFANVEYLTIQFQLHGLVRIFEEYNSSSLMRKNFIKRCGDKYKEKYVRVPDTDEWSVAYTKRKNENESLFEFKYRLHFDVARIEVQNPHLLIRGITGRNPEVRRKLHPDIIEEISPLKPKEYYEFWKTAHRAMKLLRKSAKGINEPKQAWADLKIRDLHIAIGGKNAAAEFFKFAENRAHAMGVIKLATPVLNGA